MLPGALQGAKDFGAWAARQGFEVILRDDRRRGLHAKNLKDLLARELKNGDVSRLFVYFAGHGVARGYMDDIWLLSGAPEDDADAISLARSLAMVRKLRIAHVAIFADACRTAASATFFNTRGQSLFKGVESHPDPDVEVDLFLATGSGDRSWEVQSRDDPAPGRVRDLHELPAGGPDRRGPGRRHGGDGWPRQPRGAVTATGSAFERGGARRGARKGRGIQYPESVPVTYWEPNVIAWIPGGPVPAEKRGPDDQDTATAPRREQSAEPRTYVQVWAERLDDPDFRAETERSTSTQASHLEQPDAALSVINGAMRGDGDRKGAAHRSNG